MPSSIHLSSNCESQGQCTQNPDGDSGAGAECDLGDRVGHHRRARGIRAGRGQRCGDEDDRCDKAVIQPGLDIECLANAEWHGATVDDRGAEGRIGRRQQGRDDDRVDEDDPRQDQDGCHGAGHDRQRQTDGEEADRKPG